MPVEIAYELPYTQWDWRIGIYIAMLGLAGGAYLTGYIADLLAWRNDSSEQGDLAKYGYLLAFVAIAIGAPILLSHLATPFAAVLVPLTMTNLGSWMAIGSYLIMVFAPAAFLMFAWLAFGRERPHARRAEPDQAVAADGGRDVVPDGGSDISPEGGPARAATGGSTGGFRGAADRIGILGGVDKIADLTRPSQPVRIAFGGIVGLVAAGVLVYSAMAYGSGATERVALWNATFLLPVQIFGGLGVGGTAAIALTAAANRSVDRHLQSFALVTAGFLALTIAALIATFVLLPGQVPAAEPAIENLLSTYAVLFAGVAVVGGLLIPIALSTGAVLGQRRGSLSPSSAAGLLVTAGILVIVGKVALALSYLLAAEFTPLPLVT